MNPGDAPALDAISRGRSRGTGWRVALLAGLGVLILGVVLIAATLLVLGIALILALGEDVHHGSVPGDARPAGFKQLAQWDSCGASGHYCSEVIVFGQNGISFDDAVRPIQSRFSDKSWRTNSFEARTFDDGGIVMSNPGETICIMLSRFNALKFRGDTGAPKPAEMSARVEPFSTVVKVSAGGCG